MVNPRHKKSLKFDEIKKPAKISSGKNNLKKRTLRHNELQLKIAKHIAMNGEKSPFDIENEFKISKTLSNKTIGKMSEHEYIHHVKSKKVSGGDRQYYKLTEKGIKWILDKGKLSFEEFWNLLFLIYSKEHNEDNFKNIENMIKDFEMSNQINREYFFLYEHFAEFANIRKLVTKEKMLTNRENIEKIFYKTIKPNFMNLILGKKQKIDSDLLYEFDFRRLVNIVYDNKRKNKDIHLTPFGDMLLLYCFYDDAVNMKGVKFNVIKKKLEKKYPLVFDNWELIKKITNWVDTSLVNCFLNLHVRGPDRIFDQHKRSMKMYASIGFDDDIELLKMFYFMQNRMKFQFKKEFDSSTKVIQNWAQKENALRILLNYHKMPSKHIKILAFSKHIKFSKKDFKQILIESAKSNQDMLDYEDRLHEKFAEKWSKNNLSRTNEEKAFLSKYRKESVPDVDTIKKVMNAIKPITEYAVLYNYMVPRDPELYLSTSTSKFFSNKIFSSLYNIISFQFYLILKLGTSQKKWDELMNREEMKNVQSWFNEWVKVITDYYSEIIHQVREQKPEQSQYSSLTNPVFLEELLISKYNLFGNNFKIKDAF